MAEENDGIGRQNERHIRQFQELDRSAQRFGSSLSSAFSRNVGEGKRLETVLLSIGKILLRAALKPLMSSLSAGIQALLGTNATSGTTSAFARGGVIAQGRVTPFAAGGVVASPTYFPLAGGTGLMGERGAEAIMPLARGPDGRLGVAAGGGRTSQVVVNIATPDAESFRRSEAQVAASLARAVARGL